MKKGIQSMNYHQERVLSGHKNKKSDFKKKTSALENHKGNAGLLR